MSTAPAKTAAPPMSLGLYSRLSFMMFLQYGIWGAWVPILVPFLQHRGLKDGQIGIIAAVGALGAIFAPFVAGQIADRWFATERFLGLSHLIGAGLMWKLASLEKYEEFLWFSLIYSLVYTPTLALTNSLAFHHMPDRDRDFGKVRLWGTIGWIAAGIAVGQWLLHRFTPEGVTGAALTESWNTGRADAFTLAAVMGAVMGVFCFFLPHTPPMPGRRKNATWEARDEIQRNARLMALFLFSVVVSVIHQYPVIHAAGFFSEYQAKAGAGVEKLTGYINNILGVGGGGLMTLGQISEIVVLATMPFFLTRFSKKSIMAIGLTAYAVRMACYTYVDPISNATGIAPILILMFGIAMHGICFGGFIFLAFMIIDEETTNDVRASAQALYNVVIFGIGIIIGSPIAMGLLVWAKASATAAAGAATSAATDAAAPPNFYPSLWGVMMWLSLLTLVAFLFLYPGKNIAKTAD
jgi:nucleoside transporter